MKHRTRRLRSRRAITIISGPFYSDEEFDAAVAAVRLARSTGAFLFLPENYNVVTIPGQSRVYIRKGDRVRDVNWTVVAPMRPGERLPDE